MLSQFIGWCPICYTRLERKELKTKENFFHHVIQKCLDARVRAIESLRSISKFPVAFNMFLANFQHLAIGPNLETIALLRAQAVELKSDLENARASIYEKDMISSHLSNGFNVLLKDREKNTMGLIQPQCPPDTWLTKTTANPPYQICVRFEPHVIDRFVTVHGHLGQCAALRSVFISLFTLFAITGARQTENPLIVDVGANIGVCNVLFATMGFASKRDTLNDPDIVTHGILPAVDSLKRARAFAVEPDIFVSINSFEDALSVTMADTSS